MSAAAVADLYAIGAAGLALWAIAVYPSIGPRSVRSAFLLGLAALCSLFFLQELIDSVVAVAGRPVGLIFVALPILTFTFWAAAHLLRSLLALIAARP